MSILAWIIVGLIAGLIARALVPGNEPGGLLAYLLVGILAIVSGIFRARVCRGHGPEPMEHPGGSHRRHHPAVHLPRRVWRACVDGW